MSGALLETRSLSVTVPGRVLVESLDSTVRGGEFIALLGGNGTGKSLLMRTLAGLRPASSGTVQLGGQDLQALPRRTVAQQLGFLPQDPEVSAQGSVLESVMLGRYAHLGFWEMNGADGERRAQTALAGVGLGALAARELATLSGGEQRRAAIARLLVQSPSIYLLDEPTNHLDPAQQFGILEHLRALVHAGAAVLASLHDPNLALRFADRAWLLSGDGRVVQLACHELGAPHLARLYGIDYAETRLGDLRLMAPAMPAGNR